MLEVEGCSVNFGGIRALRDVSIKVSELEIVGIIGPNGAGKTTLFDVISGFRKPDAGQVRFRGVDITGFPDHQRAAAGIARSFQNLGFIRGATVRTNLLAAEHLGARYSATAGILGFPATWADERRLSRRAGTLAEILGLTPLLDHEVDGLPYGLLKRVELAAVLATDPDLVLLDEPTSGMGPAETDDFAAKLLELRRAFQLTVLMIEHHVPFVRAVPSRGGSGLPRHGAAVVAARPPDRRGPAGRGGPPPGPLRDRAPPERPRPARSLVRGVRGGAPGAPRPERSG